MPAKFLWTTLLIPVLISAAAPARSDTPAPDAEPTVAADSVAPDTAETQVLVDLTLANEQIRTGAYTEANQTLAALMKEHPDDPRVLLMRGEVLLALQSADRALPMLERVVAIDPERPRAHFQLGTALHVTGDRAGALVAYLKEIEVNDDPRIHVMARLNRSVLLAEGEDWAAAAGELEGVVALEPDQLQAYGDLAGLYLRAGKLEEAARTLDRGSDQGFRSAKHLYSLGARYYDNESYESAIERLRMALELDPQMAEAERTLAEALDRMGRHEEALPHLRRYLELRPDAADSARVTKKIRSIEGR